MLLLSNWNINSVCSRIYILVRSLHITVWTLAVGYTFTIKDNCSRMTGIEKWRILWFFCYIPLFTAIGNFCVQKVTLFSGLFTKNCPLHCYVNTFLPSLYLVWGVVCFSIWGFVSVLPWETSFLFFIYIKQLDSVLVRALLFYVGD